MGLLVLFQLQGFLDIRLPWNLYPLFLCMLFLCKYC